MGHAEMSKTDVKRGNIKWDKQATLKNFIYSIKKFQN